MKSGIYKITNLKNGKFYIGSSKDIERRWWEHKNELNKNSHINKKLQNSWNFYGKDNFKFEIIEELKDKNLLLEREQYYLDTFQPYRNNIGYNIALRSSGGDNFTHNPNKEIIRQQLSEMYSGENNPMFGKKHNTDSIIIQKQKASGRFTLNWFIEKYGIEIGSSKYKERRNNLSTRKINYSYNNKKTGTKYGPMDDKEKIKISTSKNHIKQIKDQLYTDLLSNQYTIKELSTKYNLSGTTIKYHKRKIKL
jgi:group I intron endonuclease